MKKTLIFHIGAHRTATSSLQQFLFQNSAALKELGLLYPYEVRRHVELINKLFNKRETPAKVSEDLLQQMDSHSPALHTVVLSDEDICMRRDLTRLAEFREHFDVKIVFTLRRQDLWLESWFLQNIKWQWDPELSHCDFDTFMARRDRFHWIDYDAYLHHLETVFGRENLVLNVFEKQQMPQGPIQLFCDSIGLEMGKTLVQPRVINQSFSPLMSEFLRHLPMDKATPNYRRALTRACAKADKKLYPGGKYSALLMSHESRQQVHNAYAASNQAVAQRYFNRDQLFLDPLPDVGAEVANMQLPQASDVLMEKIVGPVFAELIAGNTNTPKHKAVAQDPATPGRKDVVPIGLRSFWRKIRG